jgi:hypothetical protein
MEMAQRGRGGFAKALPDYSPPKDLDPDEAEAALKRADDMVRDLNKQIWNCETLVLQQRDHLSNFLTGYDQEALLSGAPPVTHTGRIKPEERIFSNSSVTRLKRDEDNQ